MNRVLILGAALLLGSVSVWAQHDDSGTPLTSEAELEALCQDMATEDKISAADMDEYMKDCMNSIAEEMPTGDQEEVPADK